MHHPSEADGGESATHEVGHVAAAIDALYAAYNGHSPAAAGEIYGKDGIHREIAQQRLSRGRDEIRQGLEHFFAAFPDAHWQEKTRVVAAPHAAVSYRLTGSLQARLGGLHPGGQRLNLEGVHIFEVAADGIAMTEDYWDSATFMTQMREG